MKGPCHLRPFSNHIKRTKIKNKKRKLESFISKAKISVEDRTIRQSSNITLNCNNKATHKILIDKSLDRHMAHKKGLVGRHTQTYG